MKKTEVSPSVSLSGYLYSITHEEGKERNFFIKKLTEALIIPISIVEAAVRGIFGMIGLLFSPLLGKPEEGSFSETIAEVIGENLIGGFYFSLEALVFSTLSLFSIC